MHQSFFMRPALASTALAAGTILLCAFTGADDQEIRRQTSWNAFVEASVVLRSPRCLNCHAAGEHPTQGDSLEIHNMGVVRGEDGRGSAGMRCESCHQSQNVQTIDGPPGAQDWHMPGASVPMSWQGLSVADLCEVLIDTRRNGGRTPAQVIDHLNTGLVRWAWNPGPGRSIPPISYELFITRMTEWQQNGAACGLTPR